MWSNFLLAFHIASKAAAEDAMVMSRTPSTESVSPQNLFAAIRDIREEMRAGFDRMDAEIKGRSGVEPVTPAAPTTNVAAAAASAAASAAVDAAAPASSAVHQNSAQRNVPENVCVPLANKGTYFSMNISVGTPPQQFEVVVDTGSNALLVPSCTCKEATFGACSRDSRCFTGTNTSSTFELPTNANGHNYGLSISFGSGTVDGVIAKDVAKVGEIEVFMSNGFLLMTRNHLSLPGVFEGILGLGLPSNDLVQNESDKATNNAMASGGESAAGGYNAANEEEIAEALRNIFGGGGGADSAVAAPLEVWNKPRAVLGQTLLQTGRRHFIENLSNVLSPPHPTAPPAPAPASENESIHVPIGFMEEAGIERFSVCFEAEKPGVLRLGQNVPMTNPLTSVGKMHWGLDFRGVSIGHASAEVVICGDTSNLSAGQETACAAIPDSGTTLITAPKEQIEMLLEAICDGWTRCSENYSKMVTAVNASIEIMETNYGFDPFEIKALAKTDIVKSLLSDCGSWLNDADSEGLNELPSLFLHVRGGNGNQETIELPGWAYILETMQHDLLYQTIEGLGSFPVGENASSPTKKVCSPAFGALDYATEKNGPVWILGSPLFYEYTVSYSVNKTSPSMSFQATKETPCAQCGANAHGGALVSTSASRAKRKVRRVAGPLRLPNVDVTQPL